MFLQIMRFAGDIGGHFHTVREPDAGDFTNSGVRLARSLRGHLRADAALEGRWVVSRTVFKRIKTAHERDDLRLARLIAPTIFRQLIDGGHLEKEDPCLPAGRRDESETIYRNDAGNANYSESVVPVEVASS